MGHYDITGDRVVCYDPSGSGRYIAYRAWGTVDTVEYEQYISYTFNAYLTLGRSSSKWEPGITGYYSTSETSQQYLYYETITSGAETRTIYTQSGTITRNIVDLTRDFSVMFIPDYWSGSSGTYTTVSIPALRSFTLSYDANGGSGAPGAQTLYYGKNFTVSSTQPTRSGYTFRGWTDGSTQYSPGTTYAESKHTDLTLYAIWHKNPTITTKNISSPSPYYKGLTNCSVTYSGASASDGASFYVEIKVGSKFSQTSYTSSGTLSVIPQETGSLSVTVTITDSLGASTSYSLSNITVNQYVAPSVVVNAERTKQDGSISNDSEAKYGLITVTFTVPSKAGYPLSDAPTIKLIRSDNVTINNLPVTWYSTRNTNKIVSSPFSNWSSITSGTTIYGIIGNTSTFCDPNYAYQVSVTPRDNNNQATKVTKTAMIPPLFYTIDFLAGGEGIAFGAAAVNEGFYCNMDSTFGLGLYLNIDESSQLGIDDDLYQALNNTAIWGEVIEN